MIKEVVRQCVEKGLSKEQVLVLIVLIVNANTVKLVPERVMKRLAQKILKNLKDETGDIPEEINQDIPDYKQIENHKEAKATMKSYLEELIEATQVQINPEEAVKTQKMIDTAREILDDPRFLQQKV